MKSRTTVIAVAAALTFVLAALIVVSLIGARDPEHALRPDDARMLAIGERIYSERCASCHGARLEGQPDWRSRGPDGLLPAPPHDASGHTWHHPDALLFRITKFGPAKAADLKNYVSAMPAYDGVLTDEEIIAVLSWIKSRWPASLREKHDQFNAQTPRTR